MKVLLLLLCAGLMISASKLSAAAATYSFCVSCTGFPSFKATVHYRAVDFGENAARQVLKSKLTKHLKDSLQINPFNQSACPCRNTCPLLELDADSGVLNDGEAGSLLGKTAGTLDALIYNISELWNDPGGFIKESIFGIAND
ncbi:MAG: hypothetical protein U5L96_08365 [Owenweeksia sp.]|nr:hypothetical protein [Owenweeksia sp.]